MMKDQFPAELRALGQWMVAGKGDQSNPDYKRPIDPKTGQWGSPTDPKTWATFEQAMASPYPLKGFVFHESDPYTVIDLDTYKARVEDTRSLHAYIVANCGTYCEASQSGQGTHIIGRGFIAEGARNDANAIEIYSHGRFMICTGNPVGGLAVSVADFQETLNVLYPLMKNRGSLGLTNWRDLGDGDPSGMSDAEVIELASNAENGDKFDRLCSGDKSDYHDDWSRADSALIQFLCFYTPDNQQVYRLFMLSKLADREKAHRPDYIPRTIMRMRERIANDEPPAVEAEAIMQRAAEVAAQANLPSPLPHTSEDSAYTPLPPPEWGISFPPGLVGELAAYVYASAIRPVPEIALATAITMLAGIVGRNYNVSKTGLNQYVLLLAKTGTGKESVQSSIDRLFVEIAKIAPQADLFLGPAHFSSGPALVKTFQEKPCFVSVLGEFGHRLKAMIDPRANSAETTLLAAFLDIYGKSGWGQMLRSSVYSDKEKNTTVVHAPALTILGETEPDGFFASLDERAVTSGFLPRFTVIEYTGDRPNRNRVAWTKPPEELVRKMANLVQAVFSMATNHTCVEVNATPEALAILDAFDEHADDQIRGSSNTDRYLWNRAHLKALRMAALVAVGVNPFNPTIGDAEARWAVELVKQDIGTLQGRFQRGDVGSGDSKLQADLVVIIRKYLTTRSARFSDYHDRGCIPHRMLMQATAARSAFKTHKLGATRALKDTLNGMVESGMLVQLSKQQAKEWFKTGSSVYALGDQWDE